MLVPSEDCHSSGGLDILHSSLRDAEISGVFLLGDDGPPIDLGHHGPVVASLVSDVLDSSEASQLVGPGLSSLDVENTTRGVGGVGLDLDHSVRLPGDIPLVAQGPRNMLTLLLLSHPQGSTVALTSTVGYSTPVPREVTATLVIFRSLASPGIGLNGEAGVGKGACPVPDLPVFLAFADSFQNPRSYLGGDP